MFVWHAWPNLMLVLYEDWSWSKVMVWFMWLLIHLWSGSSEQPSFLCFKPLASHVIGSWILCQNPNLMVSFHGFVHTHYQSSYFLFKSQTFKSWLNQLWKPTSNHFVNPFQFISCHCKPLHLIPYKKNTKFDIFDQLLTLVNVWLFGQLWPKSTSPLLTIKNLT